LTEMIRNDDKDRDADHVEFFEHKPEQERNPSIASSSKGDASSGLPALNENNGHTMRHGDAVQVQDGTPSKMRQSETKHAGDVDVLHTSGTSTN
jgi:hypothetical protein